jgi:hypothetical protein
MLNARQTAALHHIPDVVRAAILADFNADSCTATAHVTLNALDYFGIPAKPVGVSVLIVNADAAQQVSDYLNEHGADRIDDAMNALATHMRDIAPETPNTPWTLGLGVQEPGQDGAGHVVVTADDTWLLDPSLDQANRPLKNMYLEPLLLHEPDLGTLETGGTLVTTTPEGCVLVYRRDPRDLYLGSPNFYGVTHGDRTILRAISGQVIRALKELV